MGHPAHSLDFRFLDVFRGKLGQEAPVFDFVRLVVDRGPLRRGEQFLMPSPEVVLEEKKADICVALFLLSYLPASSPDPR